MEVDRGLMDASKPQGLSGPHTSLCPGQIWEHEAGQGTGSFESLYMACPRTAIKALRADENGLWTAPFIPYLQSFPHRRDGDHHYSGRCSR
jgi:hypothetical protein